MLLHIVTSHWPYFPPHPTQAQIYLLSYVHVYIHFKMNST